LPSLFQSGVMKNILFSFFLFSLYCGTLLAQETFPVNGVYNKNHTYYAFTNANIFIHYGTSIEKGTLLIRDGFIEKVGTDVTIPKGAVITDLNDKYIYPSLIDIYTTYGIPEIKEKDKKGRPQINSKTKGAYHWNEAIRPETEASKLFNYNDKQAEEMRKMGFGTVLSYYNDGIARGTSVLSTLAKGKENELIIKEQAADHYSFYKGTSQQDYPSSLMGSIALLRQTYLDAEWYRKNKLRKESNLSLEALNDHHSLPKIFEVDDKYTVLRADKVGDEFGVQYIFKTGGDGYQRIDEMKGVGALFILPLNFPKPYDVENPYDALNVSLADMKHWEMAPINPGIFEKNQLEFAISTVDLEEKGDFWENLRKAIKNGLSEGQALKSLTYTPAKMLKVSDKVGSLKSGMLANFLITSGNLFDEKNIIHENWIQGKQYVINDYNIRDIRGNYELKIIEQQHNLEIGGELGNWESNIVIDDTTKIKVNISVKDNLISLHFKQKEEPKGTIRLAGTIDDKGWAGRGQMPNGDWIEWSAKKKSEYKPEEKEEEKEEDKKEMGVLYYPNMAYGWTEKPKQETVLLKNATVWTNEKEGILKETDVLIQNGKIASVGKSITPPQGTKTVDASGMHISAGIVDEHSHIAIAGGVNESGQAISSEVSIADVINSDNINIYRQLAGGVTSAQLLHGSANPIGGQSGLIKFRWGWTPEEMKIKNADGFIKFALGENVKQSNWGDKNVIRYPQSRMGVEQLFYDAFIRAKEYESSWKKYNSLSSKQKAAAERPRKDLELETLVQILNSVRFVTCHSYTQAEINMLMHVADSMGFKINTFTHILEGYKVADKMKAHGVGASTFSDWWAYKVEVNDAIPYNGAILTEMGVVTAYNSDDAEMARRLNQEAAKAVKYGGVSQEEALKIVTLNPAKLLHIDHRVGSIKVGKDADLVLWTANPLSVYAKVKKTYVDGICFYDAERDEKMRGELRSERARLIQKMLKAKSGGDDSQKAEKKEEKLYRCMDH